MFSTDSLFVDSIAVTSVTQDSEHCHMFWTDSLYVDSIAVTSVTLDR
jgi:hypothetical protein